MSVSTKRFSTIVMALAGMSLAWSSASASAQTWNLPGQNQWVRVATATYLGGTGRMDIHFVAEVETRQIALVAPQQCAPRALASRAEIENDFNWNHSVDLRFVRQERVAGYIRAFYAVGDLQSEVPLVTGVIFSFTQVNQWPTGACPITVYALPGGI